MFYLSPQAPSAKTSAFKNIANNNAQLLNVNGKTII